MVSASRTSAPRHRLGGGSRLKYRLTLTGRSQPARLEAFDGDDDSKTTSALGEAELKARLPDLSAGDREIVQQLRRGTIFGQIGDGPLAALLPLLVQRRVVSNGQRMRLEDLELNPRVRVDFDDVGRLAITLGLTDEDGDWYDLEQGRLLAGSQAYYVRDRFAFPVVSKAAWELAGWAVEPVHILRGDVDAKTRDAWVTRLAKAGVPASDLELLAVQRGLPDLFRAEIWHTMSGDDPVAHVRLFAHYGADSAEVMGAKPASPYLIGAEGLNGGTPPSTETDTPIGHHYLVERDLNAEEDARKILRALKFRWDKELSCFIARKETALDALDANSTFFPATWAITRREDAPLFYADLDINAEVRLLQDRGMIDLSLTIATRRTKRDTFENGATDGAPQGSRTSPTGPGEEQSADATEGPTPSPDDEATVEALIEMRDLLKWLQTGKRYLQLEDGTFVAPSKRFRQSLLALEDLGVDSKRALISPLCVGVLRLLGNNHALATADEATQAWLDEVTGDTTPKHAEPPKGFNGSLRDYQQRGLDWLHMLHRHRLTGILADDMGLGKTVQTLCLLLKAKEEEGDKPSIVVAPTSVIGVWRDEAQRFTPSLRVVALHGPPSVRHSIDPHDYDLLVTSYGILRRDAERLADVGFRYVILDEAQAAKNAATQNAKAVRLLKSERRLAVTGTPIENRADELWSAFDFLAPGFLASLRRFRKRYARPIERREKDALVLLRARVQPLILRRIKGEVAKELPPKTESIVRCSMERPQRALYDHVAGTLRRKVLEKVEKVGIKRAQLDILAALTRLRQICCDPRLLPTPDDEAEREQVPPSAKLELFEELMREALASDRRVLVFSQFVKMQRRIIESIKKLGVNPLWLHGGTKNRDKVVRDFQDENGPPVIVVSLKAGGTGLTLTRADTVMHYDPWWNPAVEQQATDRTHRLGQRRAVTVYKLICEDTIEEKVVAMAEKKKELAASLLTSDGFTGAKHITRDEILNLLT